MKKTINIIMCSIFTIFLVSCGAITRKDMMTQTIYILDIRTGEPLDGVQISINNKSQGKTDEKGIYIHTLANINTQSYYEVELKKPKYETLKLKVYSKPGGQYIAGGVLLGLLAVVPMIVSLGVDGGTGTWYTYTKKIKFEMIPQ